jgi:nicotinate dehydrogenase subunit A
VATRLSITVNGKRHKVAASANTPLLYILRNELGLQAPRFGCGLAQCGACTVHVGGKAVRSCITPVAAVGKQAVTTLEGISKGDTLHPVQEAFIEEAAAQCGYCINGMIMQSVVFLRRNPRPTEEQIKKALAANICRCGTHYRIVDAVKRAAEAMA